MTMSSCLSRMARPQHSEAKCEANPVLARLAGLCPLNEHDRAIMVGAIRRIEDKSAGQILYLEGQHLDSVCVLIEGMACRYQMLPGGRRQIVGYILPGDLCDINILLSGRPDHSTFFMTRSRVGTIAAPTLIDIIERHPAINRSLRVAASIDQAILRQWLLNIGQRHGVERLSHFLCEYVLRMSIVGQVKDDGSVPFWFGQIALADTLGMSLVHVNRSLQKLRRAGVIRLMKRCLTIVDRQALTDLAGFDPQYLVAAGSPIPKL